MCFLKIVFQQIYYNISSKVVCTQTLSLPCSDREVVSDKNIVILVIPHKYTTKFEKIHSMIRTVIILNILTIYKIMLFPHMIIMITKY